MSDQYERCKKCSLTFRDYLLENGICPSCQQKIYPENIALMEFKPLTPFFEDYEKELEQ